MRLPNAHRVRIERDKIDRYLLDIDHPHGGSKAGFFFRYGFSPEQPEELEAALRHLASVGRVVETEGSRHGIKYVVDGKTPTPDNRDVVLRTIWIILQHEQSPRFVTAYPYPGHEP